MRRLLLPTLAALSAAALAGCGNKGPLVLPARPVAPASAASAALPAGAGSAMPAPATSTPASTGAR